MSSKYSNTTASSGCRHNRSHKKFSANPIKYVARLLSRHASCASFYKTFSITVGVQNQNLRENLFQRTLRLSVGRCRLQKLLLRRRCYQGLRNYPKRRKYRTQSLPWHLPKHMGVLPSHREVTVTRRRYCRSTIMRTWLDWRRNFLCF